MAGIDHTVLMYKNGAYVRDESVITFSDESYAHGVRTHLVTVPFEYTRDGEIVGFDFDVHEEVDNDYYESRVCRKNLIKFFESDMCIVWVKRTYDYNVSVYIDLDTKDTYVLLGGYGHYMNPFTHYCGRGCDEEFERKLIDDAYKWLMEREIDYCKLGFVHSTQWHYEWDEPYNNDLFGMSFYKYFNYKDNFEYTEGERELIRNGTMHTVEYYASKEDEVWDESIDDGGCDDESV